MDRNVLKVSASSPYPVSLRVDDGTTALYRGLGADRGVKRRPVGEQDWAARLRAFARPATWGLPAGWAVTALASSWRWPEATRATVGVSAGTWLVVMLGGLLLGLVGAIGLASLLAATRARFLAVAAVLVVAAGTLLLAPVLGLAALVRAEPADVQQRILASGVAPSLRVWALLGLGLGWVLVALAVLTADLFSRLDGALIAVGALLALAGVALDAPAMVVIAALLPLAGGLGVAAHAGRVTPDGRLR